MLEINGHEVLPGDIVKFKTKSTVETGTVQGVVIGVGQAEMALPHTDVYNVHTTMAGYLDMPKAGDLTYLLVRDRSDNKVRAYAVDWIEANDFQVITTKGFVDVRIYNVSTADARDILQELRVKGYSGKVL